MVQLDLPSYIFDENESEEFQNVLRKFDALTIPDPYKALLKFYFDKCNKFKTYLTWIKNAQ